LAQAFALETSEVEQLQFAALSYLWHCATVVGSHLPMPKGIDWFFEHAALFRAMPNVTPNGLVLPKRETISSYNFIHMITAQILRRYFNEAEVAALHAPINIRLVDGRPDPTLDNRPRAAVKLHSDIWAAEPANSAVVFLPIIGDVEQTSVEFMEPAAFPPELQRPLDDFSLGANIPVARTYPFVFLKNHMITVDSMCLHRTIKSGARVRLSIDFRLLYRQRLASDLYVDSPRLTNFVAPPIWYGIGESYMIVSRASVRERVADVTTNAYAARYDISGL
jgi:hypothetical protein